MQSLVQNRESLIKVTNKLFEYAANNPGVHLNLGSGTRIPKGFINIDKYTLHPKVLRCDMYRLPFKNDVADIIFSAHSIEHLPLRQTHLALRDWYRVLKPGGLLNLSLPDLDMIMSTLLKDSLSMDARVWFMFCLFGFQADMETPPNAADPPVDPGQFHCSGFSIKTLIPEMELIGYKIRECYNYEGYGTPGLYVGASK